MLKIKPHIKEMHALLEEILSARDNFKKVNSEIEDLDARYMKGDLTYNQYNTQKNKILSDKPRGLIVSQYKLYIISLKDRLVTLNSKILKIVYQDKGYEALEIGKSKKTYETYLPDLDALEIAEVELPVETLEVASIKKAPEIPEIPRIEPVKAKELEAPAPEYHEISIPKPAKLSFLQRLIYAFQAKEKPWLEKNESVAFGGMFSKAFFKYLLTGEQKQEFGTTRLLPSILSYEEQSVIDRELTLGKREILDPFMLEKQIKELKGLISRKKPDVYKASTLGYLANITVRRISIYFIEKYPEFFKKLYKAIRLSNVKILANTYINIIFFLTIMSGLISLPLFTVIYSLQGNSPGFVLLKTIGTTILMVNLTFWLGVYYPFMKSKSRTRSINTNLPFAIDHMASVIASGVSPATMFKLISSSREYGEISIEIEKVTNYVDFFGYDVLTALRAVALTTPSEDFKEFLDGFVSTIETGGDLKQYLAQKSSEALLNYRLERQKYVESLSTYSDIYTGVLIAAPLFFVTALSLVSVIGGSIGGLSVNTIITVGTYLIIPGLNVLFIIFLEMSQPEI